jgi:hypothetical protein
MEPECFDAVGTASVVPVRLFIENGAPPDGEKPDPEA